MLSLSQQVPQLRWNGAPAHLPLFMWPLCAAARLASMHRCAFRGEYNKLSEGNTRSNVVESKCGTTPG